ncbi:MAG: electron transport complex subunit RsxC [Ruminococcus sp.]|nr:electron transport complex subunit RsxC [Ruminococcus sp.]
MLFRGIELKDKKNTSQSETLTLPLPEQVSIMMEQNMGAPCEPLVKKGDKVQVGQKIGYTNAVLSAPVHSSVSGEVVEIGELLLANGKTCKTVIIKCDGLQTVSDEVKPPVINSREDFIAAVRESGCCGLGGAGFPTHVKLAAAIDKKIDYLVLNGAECEPYITSDHREMIENGESVISGAKSVMKYLDIPKCIIGIEGNKPDAIAKMQELTMNEPDITVKKLKKEYPQGAEKIITYSCTGIVVKEGEFPADKGVIVMNVSTAGFIDSYLKTGMPLVRRRLTVDGTAVRTPCNISTVIGTPLRDMLDYADCNPDIVWKLLIGGPMMGLCTYSIDYPLIKTANALLAFAAPLKTKKYIEANRQTACIRCGRCISACPMGLMPTELEKAYDKKDKKRLGKLKVNLCMNCGACSYVCPARRDLAAKNQLAKALVLRKDMGGEK